MLSFMLMDERIQQLTPSRVEVTVRLQNFTQGLLLAQDPLTHRGDERLAGDEIKLQRQNSKQQIQIRIEHEKFRNCKVILEFYFHSRAN